MAERPVVLKPTALAGVGLMEPSFIWEDFRGCNVELYSDAEFKRAFAEARPWTDTVVWVQESISVSGKHVLRGIHGDDRTWKLVSCLRGDIFLVVVNNDQSSPQFRKWQGFLLSAETRTQVLIPPRFGNGHVVLSEDAIFHYKLSSYTDDSTQFTLRWNDPALGIEWPVKDPILSVRDRSAGDT